MKNLRTAIIATIVTVLIICSCAYAVPANAEDANIYEFPAVVVGLDVIEDLVTIVDNEGEMWTFYGAEGFNIGAIVFVTVYSYGTKTFADDEIIDVEQVGSCSYQFIGWWLNQ